MVEKDTNTWHRLASDIEVTVNQACQRLRNLSNEIIEARPNPDDWSVEGDSWALDRLSIQ